MATENQRSHSNQTSIACLPKGVARHANAALLTHAFPHVVESPAFGLEPDRRSLKGESNLDTNLGSLAPQQSKWLFDHALASFRR